MGSLAPAGSEAGVAGRRPDRIRSSGSLRPFTEKKRSTPATLIIADSHKIKDTSQVRINPNFGTRIVSMGRDFTLDL